MIGADLQSGNVFKVALDAYYNAIYGATEMVGLTPLEVVELIGILTAIVLVWNLYSRARGRAKWSVYGERGAE